MTDPAAAATRKTVAAWCLYDWANSAFNTLVITFVYSTYFSEAFASDPGRGTALWSSGVTISYLLIAVLAPIAGTLADRGDRRRYLIGFTLVCVLMTAALTFVSPGQPNAAVIALAVFVIANVAFELGLVFYNAFLPSLASEDRLGRVSGYGWGLGYAGGLVCLALALPFAMFDPPPFGLSPVDGFNVRATNLVVAAWFLVFSVPTFLLVRDENVGHTGLDLRGVFSDLERTLSHVRRYCEVVRFLVARLIYNDGLVTLFTFGGIYAAGTFGFTITEVIIFGIVLNVVAGLGAWVFGFVDDRIGGEDHDRDQSRFPDRVHDHRRSRSEPDVVLGRWLRHRLFSRTESVREPVAHGPLRSQEARVGVLRVLRVLGKGHRVSRTVAARPLVRRVQPARRGGQRGAVLHRGGPPALARG